jgi:hypothetical protein
LADVARSGKQSGEIFRQAESEGAAMTRQKIMELYKSGGRAFDETVKTACGNRNSRLPCYRSAGSDYTVMKWVKTQGNIDLRKQFYCEIEKLATICTYKPGDYSLALLLATAEEAHP